MQSEHLFTFCSPFTIVVATFETTKAAVYGSQRKPPPRTKPYATPLHFTEIVKKHVINRTRSPFAV